MYKEQINDLISFLKTNAVISPIFGDRVHYVQPVKDPTDTALYINILAENRKLSQQESLVDFRIVTKDTTIGPMDIQEYIGKIKDELEKNHLQMGSSNFYQIDIQSDVFVALNGNHYEGVFTMIFKTSR